MVNVRAAACVALLMLFAGERTSGAEELDKAIERYRPYLTDGIGDAFTGAKMLRDRAAADDLAGAKAAWISARAGWERSEVFTAGFVPELDALIDSWPNADSGFPCDRSQAVWRRANRRRQGCRCAGQKS